MEYIMPGIIAAVLILSAVRRKNAYGAFIDGAGSGLSMQLPGVGLMPNPPGGCCLPRWAA